MKTTKDTQDASGGRQNPSPTSAALFKLGNRNENEEFRSKRTGRAAAQA